MLCSFKKMKNEWICINCGRRVSFTDSNGYVSPTAQCKISDFFIKNQKNRYNKSKKTYKGVGSCLLEILNKLNIRYDALSMVMQRVSLMDKNGIEWSEQNQNTILQWIREECYNRNLQYVPKLSKAILKLAIKKSKYYRSLIEN